MQEQDVALAGRVQWLRKGKGLVSRLTGARLVDARARLLRRRGATTLVVEAEDGSKRAVVRVDAGCAIDVTPPPHTPPGAFSVGRRGEAGVVLVTTHRGAWLLALGARLLAGRAGLGASSTWRHACLRGSPHARALCDDDTGECDVNARDARGRAPLHVAAARGARVTHLLECGADVGAVDGAGATALHVACAAARPVCVGGPCGSYRPSNRSGVGSHGFWFYAGRGARRRGRAGVEARPPRRGAGPRAGGGSGARGSHGHGRGGGGARARRARGARRTGLHGRARARVLPAGARALRVPGRGRGRRRSAPRAAAASHERGARRAGAGRRSFALLLRLPREPERRRRRGRGVGARRRGAGGARRRGRLRARTGTRAGRRARAVSAGPLGRDRGRLRGGRRARLAGLRRAPGGVRGEGGGGRRDTRRGRVVGGSFSRPRKGRPRAAVGASVAAAGVLDARRRAVAVAAGPRRARRRGGARRPAHGGGGARGATLAPRRQGRRARRRRGGVRAGLRAPQPAAELVVD